MTLKVDVAVCCHKNSIILKSDCLIPIQNGRAIANVKLDMRGDDTGDNISKYKEYYGEGSSIYWMWKNSDADIKGITQYRRYLNLKNRTDVFIKYSSLKNNDEEKKIACKYGNTSENIKYLLEQYDVLTLRHENTQDFFFGNVEEQFKASHTSWIWDKVLQVIKNQNTEFYSFVLKAQKKNKMIFKNMFIANKHIFNEICENSIGVTEKIREQIDLSYPEFNDGCRSTSRVLGFVLERLVGLYILYLQKTGKKILECGTLDLLEDGQISTEVDNIDLENKIENDIIKPVKKENGIVFCINDTYAGPCAATIQSVLDNTTYLNQDFEIVVLYSNLHAENQELIKKTVGDRVDIRFFCVKEYSDKYKKFFHQKDHVTIETYIRLFIPLFFREYKKILWLDSDLIVNKDVKELFDINLADNWLAAVQDPYIVTCSYSFRDSDEVKNIRNHLSNDLKIKDFSAYFNAGVILFNIEQCLKDDVFYRILNIIKKIPNLHYQDQDVLNYLCHGKHIVWLSNYWNVAANNELDWNRFSMFPKYKQLSYAQRSPYIYHFCGWCKPWDHPEIKNSNLFWKYCRKTAFYETMLLRINNGYVVPNNSSVVCNNSLNFADYYLIQKIKKFKILKYKVLNFFTMNQITKFKNRLNFYKELKL